MQPSQRDRISVDLRGLKGALIEQARLKNRSVSELVRELLLAALRDQAPVLKVPDEARSSGHCVRLSFRIDSKQARDIKAAADAAGVTVGDFIAGLVAGVPTVLGGVRQSDCFHVLVASNAGLAGLMREMRALGEGAAIPAIDDLIKDVRRHLVLAAQLLSDLQPARRTSRGNA